MSSSIRALTTKIISPSVKMISGSDSSFTIGRTTALTNPNTTATSDEREHPSAAGVGR